MDVLPKSRKVASVIALLAGWVGADDYYLGNRNRGVARSIILLMGIFFMSLGRGYGGTNLERAVAMVLLVIAIVGGFAFFLRVVCGRETDGDGLSVTRW
jgi:hypothetical protein